MTDRTSPEPDPAARYAALPEPVRLEDTITSQATTAAPDPTMGRDTETEFMLRYV